MNTSRLNRNIGWLQLRLIAYLCQERVTPLQAKQAMAQLPLQAASGALPLRPLLPRDHRPRHSLSDCTHPHHGLHMKISSQKCAFSRQLL